MRHGGMTRREFVGASGAAILAAGNAAIMKPAQMASLSFLRLAQLMAELDMPAKKLFGGYSGYIVPAAVASVAFALSKAADKSPN